VAAATDLDGDPAGEGEDTEAEDGEGGQRRGAPDDAVAQGRDTGRRGDGADGTVPEAE